MIFKMKMVEKEKAQEQKSPFIMLIMLKISGFKKLYSRNLMMKTR